MSSPSPIDADTLLALSVDEAISESDKRECWDYGKVFFARAKAAEKTGEIRNATAWRLLGELAQVTLQWSNPREPFRSYPELQGPRPFVPKEDIDDATATVA